MSVKSLWTDYIKNEFKLVRTVPVQKPLSIGLFSLNIVFFRTLPADIRLGKREKPSDKLRGLSKDFYSFTCIKDERTYYCHLRKKRGEQQNKKVCATVCAGVIAERFSGDTPRRRAFFVRSAVALLLCLGRVLVLGARERSERVTTRRQPPRQRSRRTCIKTVTHFYGCIQ